MKSRLVVFVSLLAVGLAVVGARLFEVQIGRYDEFSERAANQQRRIVEVRGPRGTIFDRRGRELAVSVEAESAYAEPRRIADAVGAGQRLGAELGLDSDAVEELIRRLSSDRSFVWVSRKIEPEMADRLRALEIRGLGFHRETRRYYPFRTLLAHVLGYTGTDGEGLAGLEFHYEESIAGGAAKRMLVNDGRIGASLADHEQDFTDPEPGSSLHLTIDAALQYIVERALEEKIVETEARAGSIVVLDPRDSAVLAMASYPTFDPNRFADHPAADRQNRAVIHAAEPGSTFKLVTAAAVLESSAVTLDDIFFCEEGGIRLGRTYINDHKSFGELTFREVIALSSNVGVIKASQLIGEETLYDAISRFGFGRRTGIDLPAESPGIVHDLERWTSLSKAYVSFGHEVAVSALQMANAYAAIGNGGFLHEPYVVRAVGSEEDPVPVERPEPVAILNPDTVAALRELMEGVVVDGTATKARVVGYRVGGKTGTAQKLIPGEGYSDKRHLASFAGMVPVEDPRLLAVVMIDEPMTEVHGGAVAAPVFGTVIEQALLYLGIAPDRELWADDGRWISPWSDGTPYRNDEIWESPPAGESDLPVVLASLEAGS